MTILNSECSQFLNTLHENFGNKHQEILKNRANPYEYKIYKHDGKIATKNIPHDLLNRTIEITGPADRKLMINAFNSKANGYMCDMEDSLSPSWENVQNGHQNIYDYVHRQLKFTCPVKGKNYEVVDYTSTTFHMRPRGLHLFEKHFITESGDEISASLFDFGVHFFNNCKRIIENGTGLYLYLPKMECAEEAGFWNEVFEFAEDTLNVPRGTICATVLVEHIHLAFEMEKVILNLQNYIVGMNCGRWDYIFSYIKKFTDLTLPNRSLVNMSCHFMESYVKLLVNNCHKHGVFAMGGMSALIPSRNPDENIENFEKIYKDKQKEASQGLDGTWIAHPGLYDTAVKAFSENRVVQGDNQLEYYNISNDRITSEDLLELPKGTITTSGVYENVEAFLLYTHNWLNGSGAVGLNNMMEDAATAEISRAQLWTWMRNKAVNEDTGKEITLDFVYEILEQIYKEKGGNMEKARSIVEKLLKEETLSEFLTTHAYESM
jgi:malate synthase